MANNSKQYKLAIQIAGKVQNSFNTSIGTAQQKMTTLGSVAAKAAQIAAAAWGAVKLTQFVGDAIDTYTSFEQEMANSAAIAGATGDDFNALQSAALEMGQKTTKSATEAAQALGYMALAGWDTQESISGLEPILRLSEATQMDLGRASDLVTDSMSALGIGVDGMMDYLNLCVQTNNKANTTAENLMEAFIGCGGAAKSTGVELSDLSTALGILANNGTKGTEAGTALNSMLVRMTSKDVAMNAMKNLGVSVYDASGNFRGLETILKDVSVAMRDMTTEEKAAYMSKIAGTNYYTEMSYLLDAVAQSADGTANAWETLESQLATATQDNALMTMAGQITDTWKGAHDIFKSAVDDMKIRLVQTFAPYAKEALTGVANVIPHITEAIVNVANTVISFALPKLQAFREKAAEYWPTIKETISTVGETIVTVAQKAWEFRDVIAAAAAVFVAFKAGLALQGIVQGFQKARVSLQLFMATSQAATLAQAALNGTITVGETVTGLLTGQITLAQLATATWSKVTAGLNAVLAANPIVLIVMAIVAVIAVVVLLYKRCEWFRNFVNTAIKAIVNFVKNAVSAISNFFSGLWSGIQSVWATVSAWFNQNVITPLVNFFSPIVEWISGFFRGCWIIIQAVWQAAGTWFQTRVITPLVSFFTTAKEVISGIFTGLWSGIQGVWTAVSSWFQNNVITPLVNFFAPIVETIGGFFTNLWANIVSVWQAVGTWFMENVATPINNAFQAVSDFVRGVINGLLGLVEGMINRVIGAVNSFIGGFNGLVSKAASFIGVEWDGIGTIPEVALPRLAAGGIVTAPTVVEAGEGGEPEAILPISKLNGIIQQAVAAINTPSIITELLDRLTGGPGSGEPEPAPADGPPVQIYYSPQYTFAGGAPSRDDMVEAERMSQSEFARYMEQWERNRKRTKF